MIHSTALVHPGAQLGRDVEVGPFAVIDQNVALGDGCQVGPHVFVTGHTVVGKRNRLHAGAVIGDAPQDLKYRGEPTQLIIGDDNVFREHVTVHRSAKPGDATEIGSHCLLMAGCHVAHNCRIGNHVILANGALLAGHVTIHDRVFISGNCLVHQFVTIGTLALMQGGAGIGFDLPPFCIATGVNRICGLNSVGLRRAGITSAERLELKRLYQTLFRQRSQLKSALAAIDAATLSAPGRGLLEFVKASKRGICPHGRGREPGETDD